VGKNKLLHFEEMKTFPNVFEPEYHEIKMGFKLKAKWKLDFFKNSNPIVLELGCGKGEYSVGLARKDPLKNFIGIDKKGARIWRGAKTSQEENINNVAFLRIKIEQLETCFDEGEISEIWITFPEPVPKKRKVKKRLTSPDYIEVYKRLLTKNGKVHLKTDNIDFFNYSLEVLAENNIPVDYKSFDLYDSGYEGDASLFQTYYEQKFLNEGVKINYLNFRLNE